MNDPWLDSQIGVSHKGCTLRKPWGYVGGYKGILRGLHSDFRLESLKNSQLAKEPALIYLTEEQTLKEACSQKSSKKTLAHKKNHRHQEQDQAQKGLCRF